MDEKILTHIDLFSGIGGFTLAGEWAGFKTVVFCEKDEFCQKVLKKHWPGVPIIEDIQDIIEEKESWREFVKNVNRLEIKIDLLTAGVPCQPASVAGKRGGKTDARWLWPETLKAICLIKPTWCILENVCGFLSLEGGLEFEQVCLELESQDYKIQPFIIPACSLNAPHRRNRVWIIANSIRPGTRNQGGEADDQKRRLSQDRREDIRQKDGEIGSSGLASTNSHAPDSTGKSWGSKQKSEQSERNPSRKAAGNINGHAPNAEYKRCIRRSRQGNFNKERMAQNKQAGEKTRSTIARCNEDAPDSGQSRLQVGEMLGQNIQQKCPSIIRDAWQEDWYEVAARFCRVDDGVPDRIHRLKALGNAIVPQIAYEILKNIAWIEKELFK